MRFSIFKTPENKSSVAILAGLLYLTAPIVEWVFYSTELARGTFPVNADSISIPLFGFMVVWLIGAPEAVLIVWFVLRSYPGRVPLFGINRNRPIWSFVWSAVFVFLVYKLLSFDFQSVFRANPLDVVQSTGLALLFLYIRCSVVYGGLSISKPEVPHFLIP
jgi:hypothetical protein